LPFLNERRVATICDHIDWLRFGSPSEWEERNASSATFCFKRAATPWHGRNHHWHPQLFAATLNIGTAQPFAIGQLANALSCITLFQAAMRLLALHSL
jgi:hypothetical protein